MNTDPLRPRHAGSQVPVILGFSLAAVLLCVTVAFAAQVRPDATGTQAAPQAHADRIVLDAAAPPQESELPAVIFDHDLHSETLAALGKDCSSCHEPRFGRDGETQAGFDYSFQDAAREENSDKEPDYAALKTLFHEGCIGCHEGMLSEGQESGPLTPECRSCHAAAAESVAESANPEGRADGGLTPSLHYLHYTSLAIVGEGNSPEDACFTCHHDGPPLSSQMLEYDSCRSCHGSAETGGAPGQAPAYADMAHQRCISCHIETAETLPGGDPEGSGPLRCAGCHDAGVKAGYQVFDPLPRLRAGQPDAATMNAPPVSPLEFPRNPSMAPVEFDHALHERANPSCVTCHTEDLGVYGSRDDAPDQRVHALADPASCVGCHETIKTTQPDCAGCHTPRAALSQADCAACHRPVAAADTAPGADKPEIGPETVSIDALTGEYNPVAFQHQEHAQALAARLADASPAFAALHADGATLCQSCHHNSPISLSVDGTPPECASCHTAQPAAGQVTERAANQQTGVPDLKLAYHQLCMGCHTRMDVPSPANTDCVTCHTGVL